VLRERQLKRGMGFYGSGARVERLVARLQAGQPIVAATLGGSVSWGAGASNRTSTSYPARFFQFLNATFPHRRGSPLLPVFAGLLAAFASHSRALLRCRIACQVITTVLQRITSSPCSRSRDHNFSNRAISATNAGTFATCTERLVPQGAHLLAVEFTFNEHPGVPYSSPDRMTFEALLRRLLRLPNAPAVLLLQHYAWYHR
jgi:hypothetical protein